MEDDLIIPKPTTQDVIFTIGKVVTNLVPVIGGSAVEVFNAIVKTPIQKRQEQLIESIIDKIKTLENDFEEFKPENLSQNELFISVLLKSLQAITKEHQKEKIDAFKNAVINTVIIEAISEDYKLLFLSYLESFSAIHLHIIKFFYDELHIRHKDDGGYHTDLGNKFTVFITLNNNIKITKETFISITTELYGKGLVKDTNNYSSYDGRLINKSLIESPLADMFIAFITGYFK